MQRMFSLKEKVHGSEEPILFRWQQSLGNYIATTGHDNVVRIWNRYGQIEEEMHLPGHCNGMEWTAEGDALCAICDKSATLFMWDATQKKVVKIDSGAKDSISFICCSKIDVQLALGTSKGNLILYNHKIGRKMPILGKHNRKIICGSWSTENKLALGGADNTLTISDEDGKTLHQTSLRDSPGLIQFSEMKTGSRNEPGQNTVSLIVGKKTLFLYKLFDPENVIELSFQSTYGKIEAYQWYGDGYVMIGFSLGYFVVISTHEKEIGQELFQVRNHHDYLSSIAISPALNYAASCGDTSVRIHDLRQLSEITAIIELEDEPKGLGEIDWTADGQILAVSTLRGGLHCYLTKLHQLGDAFGTKVAFLKSLQEVTIINNVEGDSPFTVTVDVEPSFIACGAYHIAVGMNNRAWFYFLANNEPHKARPREYLGSIENMSLNADYAAVLFEGKVQLHMIEQGMHGTVEEREAKLFPEREEIGKITSAALTNEFLIYGTDSGSIHFFFIEEWVQVNIYRHSGGIRSLYPDTSGCHIAYIDDKGEGFIYNPVDDSTFQIPSLPANIKSFLWDTNPYDKGIFMASDEATIYVYIFCREALRGGEVRLVGQAHLPFSQKPLLLYNGTLTLHLSSGNTTSLLLDTHSFLKHTDKSQKAPADEEALSQAISLRKWRDAWILCEAFDTKDAWHRLGAATLNALDIDMAIRVYRFVEDAGMVLALESLRDVEDSKLLAGMLAAYIGEFELAQDLLLSSSRPTTALDLRRDLMQWDTALMLANRLDPDLIPSIAKEYGQQLEFTGNFSSALTHYEQGITRDPSRREHDEACAAGMARMSIRVGDIKRGINIALAHPSRTLKKECGVILEGMKQFSESAAMFEKGDYYEKAASAYARCKNWNKISDLLPKITAPKIHLQYAKAREADGKYQEAAKAYHAGKDYDNEIRVLLDHLRDPERAVKAVKESGSIEGAKLVSKFFVKLGDFGSAIEFLVLSKCNDEAFQMARHHGQMETYAQVIGNDATPDDFASIAVHFENEKNHFMAGKFFTKCGQYPQAMKHLLKCTGNETKQAIEMAIFTVSEANDDKITRQLIDYLMGEADGMPKDPNYLFKLYVALKRYPEAARTAVIISKEEQNNGNYRHAHDLLFSMMRELQSRQIKVPAEMENNLLILHSYLLAKAHLKRGDHLRAARLLIRVAENISKFPEHIVALLTSTVIECHKAELKQSSFSYASMLMRPEYRSSIDPKYKKKIEQIVRKSGKAEEEEETTSPCPHCDFDLVDSELTCPNCRKTIPYCIATGRHILRSNLTNCPKCEFPAILSELEKFLAHEPVCPMCSEKVAAKDLLRVKNSEKYLGSA